MEYQIIDFFAPETSETQETIEAVSPEEANSKEYDDLNGYYSKISFIKDEFSIIMYNISSLEGIRYEFKMKRKELYNLTPAFKKLRKVYEIFKMIIEIIDENNYKIIKEDNKLKLILAINNSLIEEKEITFLLNKNKKNDKNEYIRILSDSIKKLRLNDNFSNETNQKKKIINKSVYLKNTINIDNENEENEETKEFSLNCSQCHLIPELNFKNENFPFISSQCPNKHITKKIDLLNYFEKGIKFSKKNTKCNCSKNNQSNLELYYCHNCQLIICEKCLPTHDSKHKVIFEELKNIYCCEHQMEFSSFCNSCHKNLCKECIPEHKKHDINNFEDIILSKDKYDKIIAKKDKIISYLQKIKIILDSYKIEFEQKIDKIKNYCDIEIFLFNEIINQYSKNVYNYQIIKNLGNISNFSFDEKIIKSNDSFLEKTQKIINIINKIEKNNEKTKSIKLLKNVKIEETVYSLCFLKKHSLIAMGMDQKINLVDSNFNIISSNKILDGKIAYIYEKLDGKLLVVDLNKYIKILQIKDGKLEIFKKVESKENQNFVGIELSNNKIICGGDQYLTIIEPSFLFKYSIAKTIDLEGFISNVVELNEVSFLVGQSHSHRILIYSSKDNKEIYRVDNIYLRGNNYSIAKISNDLVGIAGFENSSNPYACIFIFSIEKRNICKKFFINDIESCMVILKLNDKEFFTAGTGLDIDNYSDLVLLNYVGKENEIIINKICNFKRAHSNTIEAITTLNNYILVSDSSSNLKVWHIE